MMAEVHMCAASLRVCYSAADGGVHAQGVVQPWYMQTVMVVEVQMCAASLQPCHSAAGGVEHAPCLSMRGWGIHLLCPARMLLLPATVIGVCIKQAAVVSCDWPTH